MTEVKYFPTMHEARLFVRTTGSGVIYSNYRYSRTKLEYESLSTNSDYDPNDYPFVVEVSIND